MRKSYKIIFLLLVLILCFSIYRLAQLRLEKINPDEFSDFAEATKQLLSQIENFENLDRKNWKNKYKYGDPPFEILSMNEYYFRNTIQKKIPGSLNKIEDLWEKKFLEGQFHNIRMTSDSIIWFKTKQIENFDSYVNHSLIYGSKENLIGILKECSFDRQERINENWLKVSWRNYKLVELLNM